MKLFIDTRITYKKDRVLRKFIIEFWQDVAISQPDHNFFLITGAEKTPAMPSNMQVQPLKKAIFQWVGQRRFKKILSQWQPDKLVTMQETGFTINDFPSKKNKTTSSIPDNRVLFTGSIPGDGALAAGTGNTVIRPALRHVITSLTWSETESIKTQYNGGRSFFLFTGDIAEQHQLIELLKAFSLFKKWQQSNMQLVISGNYTVWTPMLEEKLETYKYKADVVLLKNTSSEETAKLAAACYALVYPVLENAFPAAMLWAIQSNKAIIATDNEQNRQLTNNAAWVEPGNTAEGFAKAMIQLYKVESELQLLVQAATEEAKQFNRQQMLTAAWRCIEQ